MDNLDTKQIGRWLFIGGLLVAAVFGLLEVDQPLDWLPLVLTFAAILAAVFYADPSDASGTVIRYMGLIITMETGFLYQFIKIGENDYLGAYVQDILVEVAGFLAPYVLTVVVMGFIKKHLSK